MQFYLFIFIYKVNIIYTEIPVQFRKGVRLTVCLHSFQGITLDSFMFTFVA